jgi:hypothetical protein
MTVRLLLTLAAWVIAALLFTGTAPATAKGGPFLLVDLPGDSKGFTHEPRAPLLDVEALAPGRSTSAIVDVRNASGTPVRLDLKTLRPVDDENGCLRPETREPGEGCAADGGELSRWLRASVVRIRPSGAATLWSGAFTDLAAGVKLVSAMPARSTWRLRMTLSLPWRATNEVMSDTVRFGLRLAAECNDGRRAEIVGPQATVGGDGGTSGPGHAPGPSKLSLLASGPRVGLPMTESSVSLWVLLLDLALPLGGVLLVVRSARRRAAPARRPRTR